MHRAISRTVTAVSLAGLVAGGALPAQAKSPHSEHRGGKKAVGAVVSFDEATSLLVVDLAEGEDLTATVDPDVQVKLEHRGKNRKSKSGNPSRGSTDDLVAGAQVLRVKLEDETVTKIRLRHAPAVTPPATPAEDDDTDAGDALPDADPAEEPADDVGSDEDEDTSDDDGDDDVDTPDDGDSGAVEDALPPLPVPQP